MKSIEPAAMEAIKAGEAIVTGAVEINPVSSVNYTTVGTIDLSAVTESAASAAAAVSGGIGELLTGFDPSDTVRVSFPAGQTYTAWNSFAGASGQWRSFFNVIPDGVAADEFRVGTFAMHTTSADAFADLATATFTGASSYRLFFLDDILETDNTGGLSIRVERGVHTGGGSPIRVWGGYGPIEIDGEEYLGVGDRAIAQQTSGAIGGVAQGITLSLSGVEASLVGLIDANEIKGGSCVLRRMIFASDGKTLLDAHVFDRGRVDTIETPETVGGTATIQVMVESAARGLGRNLSRQRADSDQRLIDGNDGYFKNTAYAGEKMLYWGGRKPSRTGDGI